MCVCVCTCLTEGGRLNNLLGNMAAFSMDHYPQRGEEEDKGDEQEEGEGER